MKAYHLTIAAAAAGLLLAAGSASATPVAPTSPAAMGVAPLNAAVEPVHYRRHRAARRHYYPRYSYRYRAPAVRFGYAPVVTPYYGYPYGYGYRTYPSYPYAHSYGYAPTFSFGFRLR